MTNYELIKTMSVEELAEFIFYDIKEDENYRIMINRNVFDSTEDVEEWLESEVDNG